MAVRHPPAPGWTLFEILVVLAILGIVASTLFLHPAAFQQGVKLDLAASEAASALRFARSEAIRKRSVHGVRLGTSGDRIRVYDLDTSGGPFVEQFTVYHPVDKKLYDVTLSSGMASGTSISLSDFRFVGDAGVYESMAFDAKGFPVSPIDLAALSQGSVELSSAAGTRTLSVVPGTGRVTVQ